MNKELDEKYWQLTGLTYPISEIIEANKDKSAEDKKKLAHALAWNMKGGSAINEGTSFDLYDELIGAIASELGVDRKEISRLAKDYNDDGSNDDDSSDSGNDEDPKGKIVVND